MNRREHLVQGMVVKAYSGHYYVYDGSGEWECSLRGRFRYERQQVLVGDRVEVAPGRGQTGVIVNVCTRRSVLSRPPVANVEQAVIVFSARDPEPNLTLLDRFLVMSAINRIKPLICFNKMDLLKENGVDFISCYQNIYQVFCTSAVNGAGLDKLRAALEGKVSVFAGPSGVGKSSILNAMLPGLKLKTGVISERLKRGKHTTRHVALISLPANGLVADTPGFSSLDLPDIRLDELGGHFPEMAKLGFDCHFGGCLHDKEPGCAVKQAVASGKVEKSRYDRYIEFLRELRGRRRY